MQRAVHAIAGPSRLPSTWHGTGEGAWATRHASSRVHRAFSTPPRSRQRRGLATSIKEPAQSGHDDRESSATAGHASISLHDSSETQSIYPDSRAAQRPRANKRSPLFASDFILKRPQWEHAQGRRRRDDPANLTSSLSASRSGTSIETQGQNIALAMQEGMTRAEKIPFRDDQQLRHLLSRMSLMSTSKHAKKNIEMLRIASSIKERIGILHKEAVAKAEGAGEARPSPPHLPRSVYMLLIESLSGQLRAKECNVLIAEMRLHNMEVDSTCLHHALLAAICQGDVEVMHATLEDIARLPHRSASDATVASFSSDQLNDPIISTEWTRNWTASTFALMFLRAKLSHDLELCLALLGAASQHKSSIPASASSTADARILFLSQVFTPSTVSAIISTAASAREARLTADLALWLDDHIGKRHLPSQVWYVVLRVCAEQDWYPGMAVAWQRTVVQNSMSCDEGLLQSILQCASRAGEAGFIKDVLELFEHGNSTTHFTPQEWHLVPLLDAQCANMDLVGAIKTTTQIVRIAGSTAQASTIGKNFLSLTQAAARTPASLRAAYDAFLQVGRDLGPDGGVSEHVLNVLLKAAKQLRDLSMSVNLYKVRQFVRNTASPEGCQLPTLPPSLAGYGLSNSDEQASTRDFLSRTPLGQGAVDEDLVEDDGAKLQTQRFALENTVQADISTFNELLGVAIDHRSRRLAKAVMAHIVAARVTANPTTYERAIVLVLTQPRYEAAFTYLDECKARGLKPTPVSYTTLAVRCLEEGDERWRTVAQRMLAEGYHLPVRIRDRMDPKELGAAGRAESR